MTVRQLVEDMDLNVFHLADPEREVSGGYCGDLLSWVMGSAGAGQAWMTIMSNVNVAAVAALTDVSCVILTERVEPDPPLLERARQKGVTLLGCRDTSYRCAAALAGRLAVR